MLAVGCALTVVGASTDLGQLPKDLAMGTKTSHPSATVSRQARDGSYNRNYRCLDCPNTDERAR